MRARAACPKNHCSALRGGSECVGLRDSLTLISSRKRPAPSPHARAAFAPWAPAFRAPRASPSVFRALRAFPWQNTPRTGRQITRKPPSWQNMPRKGRFPRWADRKTAPRSELGCKSPFYRKENRRSQKRARQTTPTCPRKRGSQRPRRPTAPRAAPLARHILSKKPSNPRIHDPCAAFSARAQNPLNARSV